MMAKEENHERVTFTVEETAKLLGIGRQLAYDRVRTGQIPAIRLGRRLVVPRRALERLLEAVSTPGPYVRTEVDELPGTHQERSHPPEEGSRQ